MDAQTDGSCQEAATGARPTTAHQTMAASPEVSGSAEKRANSSTCWRLS